jgi:hypothetical protein
MVEACGVVPGGIDLTLPGAIIVLLLLLMYMQHQELNRLKDKYEKGGIDGGASGTGSTQ